jgi:flagellar biogenesis protein FliO
VSLIQSLLRASPSSATTVTTVKATTVTTVKATARSLATTATTAVRSTTGTAKSVSAGSLMFQLVIGLAVVLGLIWVVSKVLRGRTGVVSARKRNAPLAVLGRQPLGKGVQIAIVKAGAETYLVGVTAHQVTRLARFRPDELGLDSPDDMPPAVGTAPGSPPPSPFRLPSSIRTLQDRTLRRT